MYSIAPSILVHFQHYYKEYQESTIFNTKRDKAPFLFPKHMHKPISTQCFIATFLKRLWTHCLHSLFCFFPPQLPQSSFSSHCSTQLYKVTNQWSLVVTTKNKLQFLFCLTSWNEVIMLTTFSHNILFPKHYASLFGLSFSVIALLSIFPFP